MNNIIYLGFTALHAAAENGQLEILKYIISQDSSVLEKTIDGKKNVELILIFLF